MALDAGSGAASISLWLLEISSVDVRIYTSSHLFRLISYGLEWHFGLS